MHICFKEKHYNALSLFKTLFYLFCFEKNIAVLTLLVKMARYFLLSPFWGRFCKGNKLGGKPFYALRQTFEKLF